MMIELTLLAIAYLSGSVPFGLILTKLAGTEDLRSIGSGNIGATNVLRTGNKKLAAATLILDALKGFLPVYAAMLYAPDWAGLAAVLAVTGHAFPIWLKFKGGKSVATALGAVFAFNPLAGLACCATWAAVAYLSRYSSLSALVTLFLSPLYLHLLSTDDSLVSAAAVIAAFIWFRHRANVKRLIAGTESKIGAKG